MFINYKHGMNCKTKKNSHIEKQDNRKERYKKAGTKPAFNLNLIDVLFQILDQL